VDLVIAESSVRYLGAVRLGDEVTASAVATERGRTSLRIKFELISDGDILVSATTTYACVGESGPVDVPDVLAPALSAVPSHTTPPTAGQ
jgi:acyl-CoA thioesterase FadM